MNAPVLPRDLRTLLNSGKPLSPQHMIALREHLPHMPDMNGFERAVVVDTQNDIVMREQLDDFSTVWQYGRLLHNIGKARDALHYITLADQLEPDNSKVQARLVEVLLDLNAELPNMGYEDAAYHNAQHLHAQEQSDYSRELLERAYLAYAHPSRAFENSLEQ